MKFLFRFYMVLFFSMIGFSYYAYAVTIDVPDLCSTIDDIPENMKSKVKHKVVSYDMESSLYKTTWHGGGTRELESKKIITTLLDWSASGSREQWRSLEAELGQNFYSYEVVKLTNDGTNGEDITYESYMTTSQFAWRSESANTLKHRTYKVLNACVYPEITECPDGAEPYQGSCARTCEDLNLTTSHYTDLLGNSVTQCVNSNLCPDGGIKLSDSCDRSCEDINMLTEPKGDKIDWSDITQTTNCVDKLNCSADGVIFKNCVLKCGSKDNIKTFSCDPDSPINLCECKDDNLDEQIPDDEDIDENTPDSKVSNSLLKSIKNENQRQTELQDEMASLLYTQNENDLKKMDSLDSIDNKMSNLDDSINGVSDEVRDMKEVLNYDMEQLKTGQDESNGLLSDIKDNTASTKDSNKGILDKLTELFDFMTSTDGISDKISTIDMEGKTQGYLDSALSQFGNVLGFSSSYGTRPQNITVTLFNKSYNIIDFSILDEHISVIRSLFLSLAYIIGFLFLLRKA